MSLWSLRSPQLLDQTGVGSIPGLVITDQNMHHAPLTTMTTGENNVKSGIVSTFTKGLETYMKRDLQGLIDGGPCLGSLEGKGKECLSAPSFSSSSSACACDSYRECESREAAHSPARHCCHV